MLKKIFSLIVLIILSSCTLFAEPMPKTWNWGIRPRPLTGVRGFPETDTEYGKGFKDGCGSAWDAVSKGLLSDVSGRRYDFKRMQKSSNYNTGWWDAMEQCTYIMDHEVV